MNVYHSKGNIFRSIIVKKCPKIIPLIFNAVYFVTHLKSKSLTLGILIENGSLR